MSEDRLSFVTQTVSLRPSQSYPAQVVGQFGFAFFANPFADFAVRREIRSKTAKDAKPDRKVSQRKRFWFSN
jgi:hypothetical protein